MTPASQLCGMVTAICTMRAGIMAATDFDGMDKVAATAEAAMRDFPSGIILGACGRIPLIAVSPANIIETVFFRISPAEKPLNN